MLWVWLSKVWSEWRTAVVIVKPETVLAWHRRGFRLFWTWKSRRRLVDRSFPTPLSLAAVGLGSLGVRLNSNDRAYRAGFARANTNERASWCLLPSRLRRHSNRRWIAFGCESSF
jgi:hypothetical protein